MKTRTICLAVMIGLAGAFPWRSTEAETSFSVGIAISSVSDFYEPLRPYGHWVTVANYGRCWYPAYVGTDWQPYANGHWEWTDQGWYWVSDEPWAWATYHYGRWIWDPYYGWLWVPDVVWAPAWVAWREGGGYYGWAPLPPAAYCDATGLVIWERVCWYPRAFVFVEVVRFCHPICYRHYWHHHGGCHPAFHQTVNITNIRVINNTTIIHRGPHVESVRQHTGHPVEVRNAADLWRHGSEQVVQRASHDRVAAPPMITPAVATTRSSGAPPSSSEPRPSQPRMSGSESPRTGRIAAPHAVGPERREPSQARVELRRDEPPSQPFPQRPVPTQIVPPQVSGEDLREPSQARSEVRRQPSSQPSQPRHVPSRISAPQIRQETVMRVPEPRPELQRRPPEPPGFTGPMRSPQQLTRAEPPRELRSFTPPTRPDPPPQERQEYRSESRSSERGSPGDPVPQDRSDSRGSDRFGGASGFGGPARGFGPYGRR